MSSNIYTAGLNNVGSYQVSGRPWLKGITFTGVQSKFYEFPNVTDHIHIVNDHAADGNKLDIVFCEPRRGLQMANTSTNPPTRYSASGFSLIDFSISLWVKITDLEVTKFFEMDNGAGNPFRFQIHGLGPDSTRFFVDGTAAINNSVPFVAGEYYNIVATFSSGNSNVYVNGTLHKQNTTVYTDPVVNITLGSEDTNGFDGVYEQVIIFDRTLSQSEVTSVYDAYEDVEKLDDATKSSIVTRYEFEDNAYKTFFPVADTTATIQDRAGNFNLSRASSNTEAFVDGRALTNALSHHRITLEGQEEIKLNCKSKQIFLKSDGDTEVSLIVGLTNIPSERMYDLTGAGIDA